MTFIIFLVEPPARPWKFLELLIKKDSWKSKTLGHKTLGFEVLY
jgi:hypothetical protein